MKYDEHIEQLLNGFVDGQLTPREQTELRRLIRNDPPLEKRLSELEKCRTLLGSLPIEKAPEDLIEKVRVSAGLPARTEEKVAVSPEPVEYEPASVISKGAAELMFRKVLSAAAIIVLAAGLLAIVWVIVAPMKETSTSDSIAKTTDKIPAPQPKEIVQKPVDKSKEAEPKAAEAAAVSSNAAEPEAVAKEVKDEKLVSAESPFSAVLELKTEKLLAAEIALKKVFEQTVASEFTLVSDGNDKYIYAIDCDVANLNSFLQAAEPMWEQFSESKLFVEAAPGRQGVVIDAVKSWQIGDIAAIGDTERRMKAAQYYAILNNSQRLLQQDEKALAQDEGDILQLLDKPKPVLTSDELPREKPSTAGKQKVHLTIELSAVQH